MATLLISFILQDSEGKLTRVPLHYNESIVDTVEKADAIVQEMGVFLAAVSGCRVRRAEATFPFIFGSDTDTADTNVRADAGATLSFLNSAGRAYSLFIPGFSTTLLDNGVVVASNANVSDFVSAMLAGSGLTDNPQASDGNELDLTAYVRGFQSTRKTRR